MGGEKPSASELKSQLQEANKAYTECISTDFLSKFLAGENVKVEDFCQAEYKRMVDLDRDVYGSVKNDWS
eukprot:CAMPEP_0168334932 /NCGR_PEP_ID=MMETSP0213-20121227/10592_1 /TAXON_ID=151035 /ORGANISM="Euplotes harpa, Strain FSP1.4" /LENGTH=69 /DNA_ID=CAMNT_0008339731 /DNA_START=17 /DNA_END=226 /DNA_ORIENTATION=-